MTIANEIKQKIYQNYALTKIKNHRCLSWEHCYKVFSEARKDPNSDLDKLSLHLAFYLASWGMLRSSFLLQRDYRVHLPVVAEILQPKYDILFALSCENVLVQDVRQCLEELNVRLSNLYDEVRQEVHREMNKIKAEVSGC